MRSARTPALIQPHSGNTSAVEYPFLNYKANSFLLRTSERTQFSDNDINRGVRNMSGVNQITIVGNVGSAPELSYGQSSVPFYRFSVAVNEQWKTDGE